MTVKFEETNKNEGTLSFEIAQDKVKKGLDVAFKRIQKQISVPGFRKGKVPRQIFNNVYGEGALYDEALKFLLPEAYEAAVKEADLEVVGQPEFDVESIEKGQPWKLTAKVSLKPEVKLGDYKGLKVEKDAVEISDEDVEKSLEEKRASLAELVLKEDAAEEGDTVVIDFEGFIDGEAFEGGQGSNHSLKLGSGSFIPGFEDQLVGVKAEEEKDVNVTFPEDYQAKELACKEATFKVKVHEVKSESLPDLDDELAKDLDDAVETLEELKNKIKVDLTSQAEKASQDAFEDKVLRQAVDNAEIEGGIPSEMVHEEIHRQMDFFLNNLSRQGIQPELYYQITGTTEEDLHKQFEGEAELRTKTNLVLEAIVKAEDLQVSEEEINEEIANLAKQYNMNEDQVRGYVSNDMLTSDIKLKKAMNLVLESAEEE
ncbi:trigger factor [Ignavigranum ruoffiae]|uniref:Trigger factor n=1 Tax=Ignavigranum ruoffiae TaxID=89093 RepID=A0A1H8ZJE3_9LACT|nr:trigger factor [Ignavigranum ruoffiae]SEP64367.1 trigger factor [Ignavigranum ruoffiae]